MMEIPEHLHKYHKKYCHVSISEPQTKGTLIKEVFEGWCFFDKNGALCNDWGYGLDNKHLDNVIMKEIEPPSTAHKKPYWEDRPDLFRGMLNEL